MLSMKELKKKLSEPKGLRLQRYQYIVGLSLHLSILYRGNIFPIDILDKSMIPVKLGETFWQNFYENNNDNNLKVDLDLVQEVQEEAQIKEEVAKSRVLYLYNTCIKE